MARKLKKRKKPSLEVAAFFFVVALIALLLASFQVYEIYRPIGGHTSERFVLLIPVYFGVAILFLYVTAKILWARLTFNFRKRR
jgi:hypothetical protein